jgi:DNA-binding GntR family transcriptional regulator
MQGVKTAAGRSGPSANRTLSDLAYERILEALYARRVPAGAFLSQADLVALLDIPVAPIRDALRILETEGVVTIHPRSGIEFVKPGLELTRSTYQFRTIIERAAVRVFAETAQAKVFEELAAEHEALCRQIETKGLTLDTMTELERLEVALHGSIVDILDNPLIESSYRRIHNYLRLVRMERKLTPPIALKSLREHIAIIAACKARDGDAADAAVQAHFAAAFQRHIGMF